MIIVQAKGFSTCMNFLENSKIQVKSPARFRFAVSALGSFARNNHWEKCNGEQEMYQQFLKAEKLRAASTNPLKGHLQN